MNNEDPKIYNKYTFSFLVSLGLMIYLAWLEQNRIHADAVHYLQLANYYSTGKFDLAISGHWSPLLPLLIAPFLALGFDPLISARILMVVSGIVFFGGSLFLLTKLKLNSFQIHLCAWCIGLSIAAWSIAWITPDLLSAGLIFFAIALQIDPGRGECPKRQIFTGILWGISYYAKAFALPFGIFACLVIAAWQVIEHKESYRKVSRSLILTLAVMIGLAAPWITLISLKYERFTISTASRFARVHSGPNYSPALDPRLLEVPAEGRISASESFDSERPWSPFENFENSMHQIKILYRNTQKIYEHLKRYDWLSFSLISLIFSTILLLFEKSRIRKIYSLPVLFLTYGVLGVYWLTYCDDFRYFWILLPFLLYLSLNLLSLAVKNSGFSQLSINGLAVMIVFSFSLPQLHDLAAITKNAQPERAQKSYRELADRLQAKNISGPLIGSSEISHRCALFVAFFLQQPCYGHIPSPTSDLFAKSNARIITVNRKEPVSEQLKLDPRFRDLDKLLYAPHEEFLKNELQAFEVRN
jgi:hypothetical protein